MTAKDLKIYAYMDVCSLVWSKNHAAKSYKGIFDTPCIYDKKFVFLYLFFSCSDNMACFPKGFEHKFSNVFCAFSVFIIHYKRVLIYVEMSKSNSPGDDRNLC